MASHMRHVIADSCRSIRLLKVWLAEDSHDIDASAGSCEYRSVVTCHHAIQCVFESLQLLDPFSVWNGIVGEAGAVGENLIGDLV